MSRPGKQNFDPYHKWLGIRKKQGAITHYDLLGIALDEDDIEVIKSAVEQRMQFVESKRGEGHDSAVTTVLNLLQEAEMTLLDPEMRRDYDRSMNLFHKRSKRRQVDPYPNRSQVKSRRRTSRGSISSSVGEDSGIVGTTVKVLGVFMVGFGIMAWFSFQLPWDKSTTSSGKSELVETQNIPAKNSVGQPEVGIDSRPLDTKDSLKVSEESKPQTSSKVAAKELSTGETKVVREKTSQRSTGNSPNESPASSSPKIVRSMSTAEAEKISQGPGKTNNSGFIPIFNGKNLQGWNADQRFWRVENGVLLGKKSPRSGQGTTYAATKDVFDDFILKLKFKLNSGDSGIQFGGKLLPGLKAMTGSHFNISYEKNLGEIGQLYVNKQLFSVLTVPKRRELANAINVTGWNDCTISAKGNRVGATINGIVVVDQEYQDRKSGSIGFQLHGSGADIAFKDIMIKKIEATTSDSNESHVIVLFNGKTLKGWKALDNKKTDGWGVKNGELILVPRKGTPSLVSEDKFDDFEFECEFWLDKKSNSGIFLRGRYELQLLDDGNYQNLPLEIKCGAIHGQLPPSRAVYRGPNRWNTLSVRLERKTVTVVLNGMKVIDHRYINKVSNGAIDDLEDQQGPIVLQSHSGSARFKNITIRRLAR